MSNQTLGLSDALYGYIQENVLRESDVLRRLREETARHPESEMQIAPEQGQFMAVLAKLIGARRALEIGVFTGYSSIAVACALPPDGRIVACDVSEEYTSVARRHWRDAGIAHKIDLRIGPAIETLDALLEEGAAVSFDMAFIDADKVSYDAYYERSLELVRVGGVILLDNMLRGGRVVEPASDDKGTRAIDALNRKLKTDERVDTAMVPIADGVMIARKREDVRT
jgi:predicted O-methyltransferase YrrM